MSRSRSITGILYSKQGMGFHSASLPFSSTEPRNHEVFVPNGERIGGSLSPSPQHACTCARTILTRRINIYEVKTAPTGSLREGNHYASRHKIQTREGWLAELTNPILRHPSLILTINMQGRRSPSLPHLFQVFLRTSTTGASTSPLVLENKTGKKKVAVFKIEWVSLYNLLPPFRFTVGVLPQVAVPSSFLFSCRTSVPSSIICSKQDEVDARERIGPGGDGCKNPPKR